jgi:arabinose-5-phosphate isomerase
MILSASGESDEIVRILNIVKKLGHKVIAVTSNRTSSLGKHADLVLEMGTITEACPLGLAPSASTTAMLALGDALALTVMKMRDFRAEDFAIYHPAGQLGRKLIHVGEAMTFKLGENLPVASDGLTVGEVLKYVSKIRRRSGAVVLVDSGGKLSGIFTDGDLRRLLTNDPTGALGRHISEVMGSAPKHVREDQLASEAMSLMQKHRIDELPVVNAQGEPVGLIDVQDLVVLRMLDVEPEH